MKYRKTDVKIKVRDGKENLNEMLAMLGMWEKTTWIDKRKAKFYKPQRDDIYFYNMFKRSIPTYRFASKTHCANVWYLRQKEEIECFKEHKTAHERIIQIRQKTNNTFTPRWYILLNDVIDYLSDMWWDVIPKEWAKEKQPLKKKTKTYTTKDEIKVKRSGDYHPPHNEEFYKNKYWDEYIKKDSWLEQISFL